MTTVTYTPPERQSLAEARARFERLIIEDLGILDERTSYGSEGWQRRIEIRRCLITTVGSSHEKVARSFIAHNLGIALRGTGAKRQAFYPKKFKSGRSVYYDDTVFKSWSTGLARFHDTIPGERTLLIWDNNFSISTRRHHAELESAIQWVRACYPDLKFNLMWVPFVGCDHSQKNWTDTSNAETLHSQNRDALNKKLDLTIEREKKGWRHLTKDEGVWQRKVFEGNGTDYPGWRGRLFDAVFERNEYLRLFVDGIPHDKRVETTAGTHARLVSEVKNYHDERLAYWVDPRQVRKRARAKARRLAKKLFMSE